MFNEKINYCINIIQQLIDKNLLMCNKFNETIEEMMLFNPDLKTHELHHKCLIKRNLFGSKIFYNKIILKEIKNIKVFKKATGDLERYLSEYGSLYCGDGILYYNDALVNCSDEEFLQIIINHIVHYMHECISNNRNEDLIKSNVLLSLYHIGLIDYRIAYAKKYRSILYKKPEYQKIIKDYIIFAPNENYKNFIINNVTETNAYKVYENVIIGFNLLISESWINIYSYKYKIKDEMKLANRKYSLDIDIVSPKLISEIESFKNDIDNYIDTIIMPIYK